jgi:hypothetical protein
MHISRFLSALSTGLLLLVMAGRVDAAIGHEDYLFQNENVVDVLATIAADEDINIVYSPAMLTDVRGDPIRVSAQLEDVKPRDAVLAVLAAAGLRSQQQGSDIIVVQPSLEKIYADLLERLKHHRDHDPDIGPTTIIK